MINIVLTALGAVIVAVPIVVALRPSDYRVARTATIAAPPAGPGAVMAWAGDKNVGQGSMTVTDSRPDEFVRFRLDFLQPFAGTADAEFTFKPVGHNTNTEVTWSMAGRNNFIAKAMGLVMNMDTTIGGQFEKGLASLNAGITR